MRTDGSIWRKEGSWKWWQDSSSSTWKMWARISRNPDFREHRLRPMSAWELNPVCEIFVPESGSWKIFNRTIHSQRRAWDWEVSNRNESSIRDIPIWRHRLLRLVKYSRWFLRSPNGSSSSWDEKVVSFALVFHQKVALNPLGQPELLLISTIEKDETFARK